MHALESPHLHPDYHAYLLRLWREHEDGPWRISLQTSSEALRLGFADLESLVDYLLTVMAQAPSKRSINSIDPPI